MFITDPPFDLKIRKGKWDKEMTGLFRGRHRTKQNFIFPGPQKLAVKYSGVRYLLSAHVEEPY